MARRIKDDILEREVLGANAAALALLPAEQRKSLEQLRGELAAAALTPLRHLSDVWAPDAGVWRAALEPSVVKGDTWLTAPWMLAEFYLYRRIMESLAFFPQPPPGSGSDHAGDASSPPSASESEQPPRRSVDPFAGSKRRGLAAAVAPLEQLAPRLLQALTSCSSSSSSSTNYSSSSRPNFDSGVSVGGAASPQELSSPDTGDASFRTSLRLFTLASLWGNRMDLSLWPAGSGGDRSGGFTAAVLDSANASSSSRPSCGSGNDPTSTLLLADDQPLLDATCVELRRSGGGRVDVIVDNAGLELVADLCLADFLVASGVATRVIFQLKGHPTFVSDARAVDLEETISFLGRLDPKEYPGCVELARRWRGYIAPGAAWMLKEDLFWTQPLAFWDMPPRLLEEDSAKEVGPCDLAFTKGDANYRRLLGDRAWPLDAPFEDVVSYFPCTVCALRTLKSEIGCGMEPGRQTVAATEDPAWMVGGRFGVIQVAPAAVG